jgi:hypothetical protein
MEITIQIRRQVATKERMEFPIVIALEVRMLTAMRIQRIKCVAVSPQAPRYEAPLARLEKSWPSAGGGNFTASKPRRARLGRGPVSRPSSPLLIRHL